MTSMGHWQRIHKSMRNTALRNQLTLARRNFFSLQLVDPSLTGRPANSLA